MLVPADIKSFRVCYLGSATLMFLLMILHATLLKESLPEHVRAAARAANKEGGCRAACAAGNPVTAFRALGRTPLLAVTTHTPTTLSPLTSWLLDCALLILAVPSQDV